MLEVLVGSRFGKRRSLAGHEQPYLNAALIPWAAISSFVRVNLTAGTLVISSTILCSLLGGVTFCCERQPLRGLDGAFLRTGPPFVTRSRKHKVSSDRSGSKVACRMRGISAKVIRVPRTRHKTCETKTDIHPPPDFRPTADWEHLRFRAAMLHRLREFFDSRGFLEVETPILSADTVVDRHLDPFSTEVSGARACLARIRRAGRPHSSTAFGCKLRPSSP